MSTPLRPEDVAKYLTDHPEFFDHFSELLASVYVPHPYGGHAIPLSERQVLTLRERSRALEAKLRELVRFGEENDITSDNVHRISVALLAARDLDALIENIGSSMRDDFNVPACALRIWATTAAGVRAELTPVTEEARVFAESLVDPYFCDRPMFDSAAWVASPAEPLASVVYVPLRADGRSLGLMMLGSPHADRFTPDMGTLYLMRLSELIGTAVRRHAEA